MNFMEIPTSNGMVRVDLGDELEIRDRLVKVINKIVFWVAGVQKGDNDEKRRIANELRERIADGLNACDTAQVYATFSVLLCDLLDMSANYHSIPPSLLTELNVRED